MYEATSTARQLQHQIAMRRGAAEEEEEECAELAKRSHVGKKKKKPAAMEQAAAALYAAHQVTSYRMVSKDAPLYSLQNVRKLMQVFQRCYWAFTPTHPSVMCDTSLRRLLTTDGGWVDRGDSLLLNVNIALAHGAHLLGATRVAEQYFERARAHLASLFDTNSYVVAEAMFSMGFYLYAQGKYDQFSYYVSLAMNACKQLKATDSMLYAKCLIAVNLDPTYSPYQKQKLVGEYNYYASQKRDTTNAPTPSCWHSATSTAHPGLRTSSSSSDTRRRPAVVPFLLELNHSSSPSPSSPTSYDTHGDGSEPKSESGDDEKGRYDDDAVGGEADDEDGDWGDKAFLWNLLKKVENVDRYVLSIQMLHQVISFRQREDPDADITPLMTYLRKLLGRMGHQLKSLKPLGSAFNTSVVLSWYGVTALHYLFSSRQQEALLTAIKYLEQAEREHSAYCASSTVIIHQMVMDVFIMFRRYDLVRRLLVVAEPFVKIHPLAQDITRGYWDAVNRHDCLS